MTARTAPFFYFFNFIPLQAITVITKPTLINHQRFTRHAENQYTGLLAIRATDRKTIKQKQVRGTEVNVRLEIRDQAAGKLHSTPLQVGGIQRAYRVGVIRYFYFSFTSLTFRAFQFS